MKRVEYRYEVGQVVGLGSPMPCEGRTIPPGVPVTIIQHRSAKWRQEGGRPYHVPTYMVRWERGRIVRELEVDQRVLVDTPGGRLIWL